LVVVSNSGGAVAGRPGGGFTSTTVVDWVH